MGETATMVGLPREAKRLAGGSAALGARLPRDCQDIFPRAAERVHVAGRVRNQLRHG